MSSGQRKRHDGWNKSIMRDGMIVILRKDGSEKVRLDPKTKETIKGTKWKKRQSLKLMLLGTIPNLVWERHCLKRLRLALRVETQENGQPVKHNYLQFNTRKQAEVTSNGTC